MCAGSIGANNSRCRVMLLWSVRRGMALVWCSGPSDATARVAARGRIIHSTKRVCGSVDVKLSSCVVLAAAALAGCAGTPMGPMVQVMPGPGKPFGQFQADDAQCRGFANAQVSGQAQVANQRAVGTAV